MIMFLVTHVIVIGITSAAPSTEALSSLETAVRADHKRLGTALREVGFGCVRTDRYDFLKRPDPKPGFWRIHDCRYLQSRTFYRQMNAPDNGADFAMGLNSEYAFRTGRENAQSPWIVTLVSTDLEKRRPKVEEFAGEPQMFAYLFDDHLLEMFDRDMFELALLPEVNGIDGSDVIRLSFNLVGDPPKNMTIQKGIINFDSKRYHAITGWDLEYNRVTDQAKARSVGICEYKTGDNGILLPVRQVVQYSSHNWLSIKTSTYDVAVGTLEDKDFRLQEFGIDFELPREKSKINGLAGSVIEVSPPRTQLGTVEGKSSHQFAVTLHAPRLLGAEIVGARHTCGLQGCLEMVAPLPATIKPNGKQVFTIKFTAPVQKGPFVWHCDFYTGNPAQGVLSVPVEGVVE